ncbi:MAG TPA: hypothetical protein VFD60_05240 [Nitrososphaeraceae archaeon]|jgi:hypothetical protein|nr:hypothetical protein [Nitrososphaeraceae archaeon]
MNQNARIAFIFLPLSGMMGFLAFTLFTSSSTVLQAHFLTHAQVAKNTTILPTTGSNATNTTSFSKSNVTTAAGPNGHKYEGGSTAGVGGE